MALLTNYLAFWTCFFRPLPDCYVTRGETEFIDLRSLLKYCAQNCR